MLASFTRDTQYPRGDVNYDYQVDIDDVTALIERLLTGNWPEPVNPPVVYEWVDLGLPSGTLWATCNIGATKPEEYGDHFAWGETEPRNNDHYWRNYKWCTSAYRSMTKYCTDGSYGNDGFVDYKTQLDPQDDAAYVNWGRDWRMPTSSQWNELQTKCTWRWTTCNGVNGFLLTGPNGSSLFLPANGLYTGANINNVGTFGYCWSRTLDSDEPYKAQLIAFGSGGADAVSIERYVGCAVRAVRVTTPDDHEWVDLGLSSGTLWATCNIGATRPEEYGDYFAWGENEARDNRHSWSYYKWGSAWAEMTKYCTDGSYGKDGFVDYKTQLDPQDDAAYVNWGENWRMPTSSQWNELLTQCTWTWTTRYGVNGCQLTGPNGSSLFLPVNGIFLSDNISNAGTFGHCWTRTLNSDQPNQAIAIGFGSGSSLAYARERFAGCAVRAVRVQKN